MGPANELLSKNTMDSLREQGGIAPAADASKPKEPQVPKGTVGLGEDETQGRDTLTYEKPSMDLFRAIFAESDASDSDDEVPPPTKTAPIPDLQPLNQPPSAAHFARDTAAPATEPKNALEPVSFADFKPTFIPKADRTTSTSLKKKEKRPKAALSFDVDDGDVSAPVLAPKLKKPKDKERSKKRHKSKHAEDEVEDEDEWVEKPVAPAAAAPVRVIPARARAVDFL
jgi:G patch domain-containing protein 1